MVWEGLLRGENLGVEVGWERASPMRTWRRVSKAEGMGRACSLTCGWACVVEPREGRGLGAVSEGKVGEVEWEKVSRHQMEQSLVGHDKGLGFSRVVGVVLKSRLWETRLEFSVVILERVR